MDNSNTDINKLLAKIANLSADQATGTTSASNTDPILEFIEKLIEEKGFFDLSPEVREEIRQDLLVRLDDFMASRIIGSLSDEDVLIFEQMLKDRKPEEEVQKFIATHIEDYVGFLTTVLLEFRGIYLGIIQPPFVVEPQAQPAQDVASAQPTIEDLPPLPPAPLMPAPLPPAPSPMHESLTPVVPTGDRKIVN